MYGLRFFYWFPEIFPLAALSHPSLGPCGFSMVWRWSNAKIHPQAHWEHWYAPSSAAKGAVGVVWVVSSVIQIRFYNLGTLFFYTYFFRKNHKSKVVKCREIAAICREKLRNVKSIFSTPKSHGKKWIMKYIDSHNLQRATSIGVFGSSQSSQ